MFDLEVEFQRLYSESQLTNPQQFAAELARRVPEQDLFSALLAALPAWCQGRISSARSPAFPAAAAAPRKPGRSWFVEGIQRLNKERVQVGGQWKLLGACTSSDLRKMASDRVTLAARNLRKAAWYKALAREMDRTGAATVAELSPDALDRARQSERVALAAAEGGQQ